MSAPVRPQKLLARLRSLSAPVDPVPRGARSGREWAKAWNVSFKTAIEYIHVGVRTGAMKRVYCRVRTARGHVRRVPLYLPQRA